MFQRFPGAHFWIGRLGQPDDLIQLDLLIGCSCSGVALLAAALAFLREKPLQIGWTLIAALIVIQIFLLLLGVYHPQSAATPRSLGRVREQSGCPRESQKTV